MNHSRNIFKMTQMTIDGKELTQEQRLYKLRMQYYVELLHEINILRSRRIELIKSYKNTVYDIDEQLKRLKAREKQKTQ